jgi:hypothetical protein
LTVNQWFANSATGSTVASPSAAVSSAVSIAIAQVAYASEIGPACAGNRESTARREQDLAHEHCDDVDRLDLRVELDHRTVTRALHPPAVR